MSVKQMWKNLLLMKVVLIFAAILFVAIDIRLLSLVLSIVMIAVGALMAFRMGQSAGHEACSVSHSLKRLEEKGDVKTMNDPMLWKQSWSVASGVKSIFACALAPYALASIYIILSILDLHPVATMASRFAAWVGMLPFWGLVGYAHETFAVLSADIVITLLVSPFVFPLFQFFGYLQGPKMWEKTEKAMVDGRRRAKARSRINRKKKPIHQKGPEI